MLIQRLISYLRKKVYYLVNRRKYAYLAHDAMISPLLRVDGKENISIANGVIIQKMTWIAAVPLTNAPKCHLYIGENSIIGNFNHIFATGEVKIGKDVLTADKVYISDNQHRFHDISIPIHRQGIKQLPSTSIGDGTWIGEGACIFGVKIGKNCVIGANSVVTKDIPDYCVAVGSPAKVIKRFDFDIQDWIEPTK